MQTLIPIGFLNLGGPEIFLASLVVLLLFAPRLPRVMRSLGKGIVEFKKGIRDTEDETNGETEHSSSTPGPREIDHSTDSACVGREPRSRCKTAKRLVLPARAHPLLRW